MKIQTAQRSKGIKKRNERSAVKRKPKARRRRRAAFTRADRFTCLWLVLFFPVGLMRMWKENCRWKKGVKYAVSGLYVALAIAIVLAPSPYRKMNGSIEIVANDPEVEIYGPAAPKTMVNGYTSTQQETVVVDKTATSEENVTVYASEDGKCYHLGDCKFAYASAKRLTVYEAYFLGYKPCGKCTPPVYDPITGRVGSTAVETETTNETEESALVDDTIEEDFDDGSPDDIV